MSVKALWLASSFSPSMYVYMLVMRTYVNMQLVRNVCIVSNNMRATCMYYI